jgi:sialidase-1
MIRYLLVISVCCCLVSAAKAQQVNPLPYNHYFTVRDGLKNAYGLIRENKKVTVAYLGGSITFNPGWRNKVDSFLKKEFPEARFHFMNAGIPSLGSPAHAFRLQRDVLDSGKIDLLFVEAAVNDRGNGVDSINQARSLEGTIRHARKSNPLMDIILMSFADPAKTKDYDEQRIPAEVTNHEKIAAYYHLPSINLSKEVHDKMNNGEFSWERDFKDLHPSPFGQELYFATIRELLKTCFNDSSPGINTSGPASMPKPLDKKNFENGKYYSIENVKLISDWILDPDWVAKDSLPVREGFVRRPMLVASRSGASLSLRFKGTAIGMALISGADAGIISWSIDGKPFRETDLFTQWSTMLHLPWYVLLETDLKNEEHILNLRIAEEKNSKSSGHACRIVYFLLNQ